MVVREAIPVNIFPESNYPPVSTTIPRSIIEAKSDFDNGYWGFIRFETTPEAFIGRIKRK